MRINKCFNGERLSLARVFRGISAAELAEKIGVKRQMISLYEGKKVEPESERVYMMCQALDFPFSFFYEQDLNEVKVAKSTYFRSLLTTNKKYRNEQTAKIEMICRIYSFLSEYVSFPDTNLPSLNEYSDCEEAAAALRNCWNLGERPIDNIIRLCEDNGIIVSSYYTSTDTIDAFSKSFEIDGVQRFTIALSKNKNAAARIHFDIAHELGHILLHEWNEDIESLSPEEFRVREKEANNFAAAFLMPKEPFVCDFENYAGKLNYYIQMKKKWKVSIAAMIYRSRTLDLIDYDTYQLLMRKMQRLGIRKNEPLDDLLITSKPSILSSAVRLLLEEGVFTPSEFVSELASDNLSIYPRDIEELLGLPEGLLSDNTEKPNISIKLL